MDKIIKILEKYDFIYDRSLKDSTKYRTCKKIKYILFLPILYIFEGMYNTKIWNNFIKKTMITNDNIFQYLDNNDFELINNTFHKIELLSTNEFFDISDEKEAKKRILGYYITEITTLLDNNVNFDIESYLNLMVNVDIKYVRSHNEYYKEKIYEVYIQSARNYHWKKIKIYMIIWLLIVLLIIFACVFLIVI